MQTYTALLYARLFFSTVSNLSTFFFHSPITPVPLPLPVVPRPLQPLAYGVLAIPRQCLNAVFANFIFQTQKTADKLAVADQESRKFVERTSHRNCVIVSAAYKLACPQFCPSENIYIVSTTRRT